MAAPVMDEKTRLACRYLMRARFFIARRELQRADEYVLAAWLELGGMNEHQTIPKPDRAN